MTDQRDPADTLDQWKAEMQAEHETAIQEPASDATHQIEGVSQVSYRVYFEYDETDGELTRSRTEQVDDESDPELLSCACGVRGMTRDEARTHMRAARDDA